MTTGDSPTSLHGETPTESNRETATVQLLVSDAGNRSAITGMLREHFGVTTETSLQDADLYLIEDHLFGKYHEALSDRINRTAPAFCPVVLIQREKTRLNQQAQTLSNREEPVVIDDIVEAPIDRSLLIRRINSLLIRRRQSEELLRQVSTLETREQDLRRFERGVESTSNGIVMTDSAGTIEYVNPAFEAITEYPRCEIIGQTPRKLLPAGTADVFTDWFWRTVTDRGHWEGEIVIERSDETRCVSDASVTAIRNDGSVEGFVIVMSDITERIQRERELEHREQELELLRQILTRYLRHNLRNDLNIILGYSQLLETDGTLTTAQRHSIKRVTETAERLMDKSDTARMYSSLLEQDDELSPHDLSSIVTDAVYAVHAQHPETDITLDVPETCEVYAREGIRYAIEGLIENAARYNNAAEPQVAVRVRDASGVTVIIEDNGPGISDIELTTIERGEETPLSHSQGIGLWLSKWVIDGIGGQLSFELTDPGTRVTIEFLPPEKLTTDGFDIPTLKERDQRLQTVISRVTDAIVEIDAEWKITLLDSRAEEILDVSADELLGRNFWDVFSDARGTQFEAVYREVMESRSSKSIEAYYSGIDEWLDVYVYPDFNGGLSFYFRETTEQNEQKAELQRIHSRMELALDVSDTTVWEWDFETDSATIHPDTHTIFGTEISSGTEFLHAIHPEDRDRVQAALETAVETGEPYSIEYRVQRGDTVRWVEDYGELRQTADEASTQLIGVAKDITERKRHEQALQERVKELTTFHNAMQVFETTDSSLEELLTRFIETIPGAFQYPERTEARLSFGEITVATADVDSSAQTLSTTTDTSDGTELQLEVFVLAAAQGGLADPFLPEERELLETLAALTRGYIERRRSIRALERTSDLLSNAERLGAVGAWEVDLETEAVHWTDGARQIHDVSADFTPTLDDILEFTHPADREEFVEIVEASIESETRFDIEIRIVTEDNEVRWVQIEGEPSRDGGRHTVRGYIQDITEEKERARRFEAIFNQTYQFTGLMEPDGTLIEANESALEFGGLSRADVIGKKIWDTHWFEISEATQRQTKSDVERAAAGTFVRRELEVKGADGTTIIDFSIRPVTDEDGAVVLLVPEGRDISALKAHE